RLKFTREYQTTGSTGRLITLAFTGARLCASPVEGSLRHSYGPRSPIRPGTLETPRTPARTRKAAHPCQRVDAASRQAPGSSRPSAREHAGPRRPLQGAPPRDVRDVE